MAQKIPIKNTPSALDLWKGIGGHFDSFDQILCEFIDNAISNFIANNLVSKTIIVNLHEQPDKSVLVSIEDSGTGIKDLDVAFCLGNKAGGETPLNEHGFGMKHALASANPDNNSWQICTRTQEDFQNQQFKKIEAPYEIEDFGGTLNNTSDESWSGELNGTGTFVKFHCPWELFYTIRKGIPGTITQFSRLLEILSEDLGFIYSGIIQENKATITLQATDKDGNKVQKQVAAVIPDWEQFYQPGQGQENTDLGGGKVKIKYSFGSMNKSIRNKYYKRNMSSSGLEIRINGRIIIYNLFKEVWGIERHNMYNHLLVAVDLISDNQNALPMTRTSKNGLREGDERFENLLTWVRLKMPTPREDIQGAYDEEDLFKKLEKSKNIHLPDPKTVSREQNVYKNIKAKIPVDLYVHYSDQVIIYEGKKDETSVKDVYQLKMYWDGCVLDGLQPTQAFLISANHPSSVIDLIDLVNKMTDLNGGNYNFQIKTWKQEGIDYPN